MKPIQSKLLSLLVLLAMAAGLSLFSAPAQAQATPCYTVPGGPCASQLGQQEISAALIGTNTQLTTTHTYLATGMGGSPGGVVALLGGINERLGMVTNANDESVENLDLAARQRIYDEKMMEVRGANLPKPSSLRRACVQATTSSGRAAAGRAGGGAARSAADLAQERYNDTRPQVQAIIDAGVNRAELGTCTATDVSEGRPGCKGQAVGDRPGADLRSTSLFDGGKKPEERNLSVDEKGFKIGQQFISNVAPLPADQLLNQKQKDSQGGVLYMLNYNRYSARASALTGAMADVLGFGVSIGVEGSGVSEQEAAPFLKAWGSHEEEYNKIFGQGRFPQKPSEREMLTYAVFKNYASVLDDQKLATASPEEIAKKQLEVDSVNARVNLAILARLEKQNLLLAALLAQQMDPLTQGQMKAAFQDIGNQQQ